MRRLPLPAPPSPGLSMPGLSMPGLSLPALALLGLLAACGEAAPPAAKVEPPRPVRTTVVQPQRVAVALQLPGEVRPRIESRLGFRVGGKLASRTVSVGDRVAFMAGGQVAETVSVKGLHPGAAHFATYVGV